MMCRPFGPRWKLFRSSGSCPRSGAKPTTSFIRGTSPQHRGVRTDREGAGDKVTAAYRGVRSLGACGLSPLFFGFLVAKPGIYNPQGMENVIASLARGLA